MDKIFDRIVDNAIDFLNSSVDDLKDKPKYSIINFSSSIELFLKARLAAEHWSLIVTSQTKQVPDYSKVKSGDFQSVNLKEAVTKLDKTVQSGLSDNEFKVFDKISKHRNKAVHFFHEAHSQDSSSDGVVQEIVKEQLIAWYHLYTILTTRWKNIFLTKLDAIELVNQKLKTHNELLRIIYERIKDQIKAENAAGTIYSACPSCSFESLKHNLSNIDEFYEVNCGVCDFNKVSFYSNCTNCNNSIFFIGEGQTECTSCGESFYPDFISEKIYHGPSQYEVTREGATAFNDINCDECWENNSVVETSDDSYRCTSCFEHFDNVYECEWCGGYTTSELEYSYLSGCGECEGHSGWHDD